MRPDTRGSGGGVVESRQQPGHGWRLPSILKAHRAARELSNHPVMRRSAAKMVRDTGTADEWREALSWLRPHSHLSTVDSLLCARAVIQCGQPGQGWRLYEGLDLDRTELPVVLMEARFLREAGEYSRSRDVLQTTLNTRGEWIIFRELCQLLALDGDVLALEETLEQWEATDPSAYLAWKLIATLWLEAIEDAQRALRASKKAVARGGARIPALCWSGSQSGRRGIHGECPGDGRAGARAPQ